MWLFYPREINTLDRGGWLNESSPKAPKQRAACISEVSYMMAEDRDGHPLIRSSAQTDNYVGTSG